MDFIPRPCPVCDNHNSQNIKLVHPVADVNRLFCLACQTYYFDRVPPIPVTYDIDYNLLLWRPSEFKKAAVMATYICDLVGPPRQNATILDICCGNGFTLMLLRALDYQAFGLEFDEYYSIWLSSKLNIPVFHSDFLSFFPRLTYYLLYASQTIEHFYNPRAFLDHAYSILAPRGILLLETPDSYYSLTDPDSWHHFNTHFPYEHQCILSQQALSYLALKCGFDVLKIEKIPLFHSFRAILTRNHSSSNNK